MKINKMMAEEEEETYSFMRTNVKQNGNGFTLGVLSRNGWFEPLLVAIVGVLLFVLASMNSKMASMDSNMAKMLELSTAQAKRQAIDSALHALDFSSFVYVNYTHFVGDKKAVSLPVHYGESLPRVKSAGLVRDILLSFQRGSGHFFPGTMGYQECTRVDRGSLPDGGPEGGCAPEPCYLYCWCTLDSKWFQDQIANQIHSITGVKPRLVQGEPYMVYNYTVTNCTIYYN